MKNLKTLIAENNEIFVEMESVVADNPIIDCSAENVFGSVYSIWESCCKETQTLAQTWADEKPYWIERGYGTL